MPSFEKLISKGHTRREQALPASHKGGSRHTKARQCAAMTKSTGKRCKHTVTDGRAKYCKQHRQQTGGAFWKKTKTAPTDGIVKLASDPDTIKLCKYIIDNKATDKIKLLVDSNTKVKFIDLDDITAPEIQGSITAIRTTIMTTIQGRLSEKGLTDIPTDKRIRILVPLNSNDDLTSFCPFTSDIKFDLVEKLLGPEVGRSRLRMLVPVTPKAHDAFNKYLKKEKGKTLGEWINPGDYIQEGGDIRTNPKNKFRKGFEDVMKEIVKFGADNNVTVTHVSTNSKGDMIPVLVDDTNIRRARKQAQQTARKAKQRKAKQQAQQKAQQEAKTELANLQKTQTLTKENIKQIILSLNENLNYLKSVPMQSMSASQKLQILKRIKQTEEQIRMYKGMKVQASESRILASLNRERQLERIKIERQAEKQRAQKQSLQKQEALYAARSGQVAAKLMLKDKSITKQKNALQAQIETLQQVKTSTKQWYDDLKQIISSNNLDNLQQHFTRRPQKNVQQLQKQIAQKQEQLQEKNKEQQRNKTAIANAQKLNRQRELEDDIKMLEKQKTQLQTDIDNLAQRKRQTPQDIRKMRQLNNKLEETLLLLKVKQTKLAELTN